MLDRIKKLLDPSVTVESRLMGVTLFIGRLLSKFDNRLIDLESKQLQQGEHGEKGERGHDGLRGIDGAKGDKGQDGKNGKDGPSGKSGSQGKDGEKGVSIVDAEVAMDGHLVLKLSNKDIIDAGEIVQQVAKSQHILSTQVAKDQITVSDTAPRDPQLNDLWLPI